MYCDICDVSLNSSEQQISHQKGKTHQKKLATRQRAEELLKSGSKFSRHCEICNVTLTSETTALDHFQGKNHKKRQKALERHNGFKLQSQCSHVHGNHGELSDDCQRTLNSTKLVDDDGRGHRIIKQASLVATTTDKMNGYSSVEDYVLQFEPHSRDSLYLVDDERLSVTNGVANGECNLSDQSSSSGSVDESDAAGMGPLTVGFGRPGAQEVQSPTRSTFQFYTSSLNGDNQKLEIENSFNGLTSSLGRQYFPTLENNTFQHSASIVKETFFRSSAKQNDESRDENRSHVDRNNGTLKQVTNFCSITPNRRNGFPTFSISNASEAIPLSSFTSLNGDSYLPRTQKQTHLQQPSQVFSSHEGKNFAEFTQPREMRSFGKDAIILPPSPEPMFASNSSGFENFNGHSAPQRTFPFSPPSSPPSNFFASSNYNGHTNEIQQNILQFLRAVNRPSATLEISKAVGFTTKKNVNAHLYQLERLGLVYKLQDSHTPVWALNPQKTQANGNRSPGVIGEERRRSLNGFDEKPKRLVNFPKSNSSAGLVTLGDGPCSESMRTRARDDGRPRARSFTSTYSSSPENFSSFCHYCKVPLNSKAQTQEHLKSTKHKNRLAKIVFRDYQTFCDYCKVHLNSESQATEHFSSSRHEQTVAKSQKAPIREHDDLCTDLSLDFTNSCTMSKPYCYQVELYTKAMGKNSVCFLPTGTGKTLVSALVIANMLHVNPTRQVIFLVDRVLLVLQQSEYLKKELSQVMIENPKRGRRAIRIGAVCGEMKKLEHGARIYEHDLLVITADCYRNHLNNGTLRFDDVSLIVLDEAHHCNKEHPYNVIIKKCYLDSPRHRPKILGLTASPAGEINLERTVKKMQRLLSNLGGAALLTVIDNFEELEEKTSRAELVCLCTQYTPTESKLLDVFVEYSTKCFNLAVRVSDLKDYKDIFQPPAGAVLSPEDICSILRVIDNLMIASRSEGNALNALLHLQSVCDAVCTLQDCGETVAIDGLSELMDDGTPHGFAWADTMGLPCSILRSYLEHLSKGTSKNSVVSGIDSGVGKLVEQLLKLDWDRPLDQGLPKPIALVLVKRRRTAHCLVQFLSSLPQLLWHRVKSTCIVGHGARSADGGMSVNKQNETITEIRQGKYQVVVATSVAEEGLDLPICELVIQMDPPSSVTALVQIRGRARHRNAKFVAICRDEEQSRRIQDLLKREENMQLAAQTINGY